MRRSYRLPFALLLCCVAFLLAACEAIDDTNGEDDTSLSQITDEALYGHDVGWSVVGLTTKSERSGTRTGNYYANEGFREADDHDYYRMNCKSASGTSNLIATKLEDGQKAAFEVESQVATGNLEVVLLKRGEQADALLYEFETSATDSYELISDGFGIYYVRAGMESFGGEIVVTRTFPENN